MGHLLWLLVWCVVGRRLGLHDGARLIGVWWLLVSMGIRVGLLLILGVGLHHGRESQSAGGGRGGTG
jgi:hypothetical protein